MKLYKLTDENNKTHGGMSWKIGKTNKVKKCGNPQLCTENVIHAYRDINLALIFNPRHANIDKPNIYECEGKIVVEDYGKCGVFNLTPIKKLRYPKWYSSEKRKDVLIQFAILCAESVLHYFEDKYPNDKRPRKAIEAAKEYLRTKNAADAHADAYADAAAAAYAAADADAAAYAAAYAASADAVADAADAVASASARKKSLKASCVLVRARIPWATVEKGLAMGQSE